MPLSPVSDGDPHVSAHNAERDAINDLETDLATKISLPSVPVTGSLLRYNGTSWQQSATRLFEGSGSPEGIVAAPKGSRYVDTSGSGAVEWLKKSGTGTSNTGWVLLFGDTGYRNIAGLIATRGSASIHSARLRRYGDVVDFYVDITIPNNDTHPYSIYTLPAGFRPPISRYGALQDNRELAANGSMISSAGEVQLWFPVGAKRDRWNGVWLTDDAWPSSLPGTAV